MSFQQQQEEASSTLAAMYRQESTSYKCQDYLNCRAQSPRSVLDRLRLGGSPAVTTIEDVQVCMNNRSKMALWCMNLTDACQMRRETVAIAMNYLDRFLATEQGFECIVDSSKFQLACMTALYSAIKVHEDKAISPQVLVTISRGLYTKEELEAMERKMLNVLSWRINVPTPLSFVREFLQEVDCNQATKNHLMSLAVVQTELVVPEYGFVTVKPSSIGFCALTNAMEASGLGVNRLNHFMTMIDLREVGKIRSSLYRAIANFAHLRMQLPDCGPSSESKEQSTCSDDVLKLRSSHSTTSPRTVCQQSC